ncbi:MAG: hypothetical protein R3F31_21415 [Verrucomicrobiales bacterium]
MHSEPSLPELDKEWGLVVDYWGVSGFLDQALEGLHEDVDPGEIPRGAPRRGSLRPPAGLPSRSRRLFPEGPFAK